MCLQVCLAAAAACVLLYALGKRTAVCLPRRGVEFLLRTVAALLLVATCVLALSGWMARRMELQGPEQALAALPQVSTMHVFGGVGVCTCQLLGGSSMLRPAQAAKSLLAAEPGQALTAWISALPCMESN